MPKASGAQHINFHVSRTPEGQHLQHESWQQATIQVGLGSRVSFNFWTLLKICLEPMLSPITTNPLTHSGLDSSELGGALGILGAFSFCEHGSTPPVAVEQSMHKRNHASIKLQIRRRLIFQRPS